MLPYVLRLALVMSAFMAVFSALVLHPAGSEAGLLDCLWGGGAGGAAQTTYTPRYVAPTVYYPSSSTTPAGPFARLRATLRSTSAPAGTTCYYVPQVSYRQVVQPTAVTSYMPVVTRDACTGYPVTAYQPVITYSNQVRLVPYTTYRLVCTKAQYAPAAHITPSYSVAPTYSIVQPTVYAPAAVPTSGSCTTLVPSTTHMPVNTASPASAAVNYSGTQPAPSPLPPTNFSVPAGSGSFDTFGRPSSNGTSSGQGVSSIYGNGRTDNTLGQNSSSSQHPIGGQHSVGAQYPSGGQHPVGTQHLFGGQGTVGAQHTEATAPGGNVSGGHPAAGGGSSGRTSGGATFGGNGLPTGTGWPLRPGAGSLPFQLQRPLSKPVQEPPSKSLEPPFKSFPVEKPSLPVDNSHPPTAPVGPALSDPGDKTALLPPLVARSGEPVRGRLVPVERLRIPVDNSNAVENHIVGGAWSIVRN